MNPRREPLLWLQLVGLGAIPLELLLVLVLLAASDPGRFPLLEWLLVWGLGAVAPSVLFWLKPPDPFSLLLVQAPGSKRRPEQQNITAIPLGLPFKLLLASGTLLLLPLLLWLDRTSVLATSFALIPRANRLTSLLLCAPVLALMVWQWQQLVQATWLLIGQPKAPDSGGDAQQPQARLCLGLPWMQLRELEPGQGLPAPPAQAIVEPKESIQLVVPDTEPALGPEITDVAFTPIEKSEGAGPSESAPVAIEPEEATKQDQGTHLDDPIG
ncbi:low-complexity tail membrane protein [Cyanobium sp. WAJ14-Wanaka]|uniref:low-complexity tail membrane protein n=1 Tax=Cyanobium sp. WAJ14-Wanaka TaxID=2823725 RepID=UPI0020CDEB23|nr:low-complexity tail membrane protein [Cyanobium sp. WAJ14-Wanaka]MCP9775272.1 low-complexity tail membrane protein [Cyanobium sp. WAJ14-Wanaka]